MLSNEHKQLIFGVLGFVPLAMFIAMAMEIQDVIGLISGGADVAGKQGNLTMTLTSLSNQSVLFGLITFMGTFLIGVVLNRKHTHSKESKND